MRLKQFLFTILVLALPSFAQNEANPSGSQKGVEPGGTQFSANNIPRISYVASSYNWSHTDVAGRVGDLTAAGPNKTLSFSSCPMGIDTSNNANAPYGVYISGTGTAEAVPVVGGSCPTGGSGTIIVNTQNAHPNGFTVGSATGGNQEAINASIVAGTMHSVIQETPTGGADRANYHIYWPVFLDSGRSQLNGIGAKWECYTRSQCLVVGNYTGLIGTYSQIQGLEFQSALNITGAHIASVAASSGAYTVTTTTAHNLVRGDYAILFYSTPAQTQEARVLITGATSNTFTYKLGSNTFTTSSGYGWVALENTAIEANSDGTRLENIKFSGGLNGGLFHQGVVVGNDQDFTIDGMTNEGSGRAFRCDQYFCGNMVYLRGDSGSAPVAHIHHMEASMQCGGNGVRNVAGNTLKVADSVIQGFSQYGIYYGPGLNSAAIDNVYNEPGCPNPFYPISVKASAADIFNNGQSFTITGNAPLQGLFPNFKGRTSANQRNYYVVAHDTAKGGYTVPLPIGIAQPLNSGVSIPLYWPNMDLSRTSGVTWDILVSLGTTVPTAPYTGNAFSIATGITPTCSTNGLCAYTDTQGSTSPYTVPTPKWIPWLPFWPGAVVMGFGSKLFVDQVAQDGGGVVTTTNLPSIFAKRCWASSALSPSYTSQWMSCPAGDSVINNNLNVGAQLVQVGSLTNMPMGITGGINFAPSPGTVVVAPRQLITVLDGSPAQTLATPGYIRTGTAKDSFIGTDTKGAIGTQDLSYGAPGGHNFYVNDPGTSGKTWALRIGAGGPQLKKFTYSALNSANPCSSNTEGTVAAVTDSEAAAWGATIVGGGSNHVLAYCDGTHWTVH